MDLEQLDSESMEQEIQVNIANEESILIQTLTSDMKEEHLDQLQTIHLLGSSQEDHDEQEDEMHEELEITKLSSTKVPKKRVSLTIEKKIEIIQRHEKGETQRSLSQEYNVGRTTISDILKRKYKFFKFMSMNADKEENLKRRRTLRRTVHKVLEDKLLDWYNVSRQQGGYISGPMISARAQELHKELGYSDTFTASNGWLDRFKIRNGIKLCGLREVKTESDINAVAPFKVALKSDMEFFGLSLDQIYNADEADLFWKMLPNPESDVNEVKASVRAYRERMTVLCCANATGTHKLPLVCIGRGKKTRTFTAQEVRTMPVTYFSQETAWMDHEIFREWFHSHFVPSVRQNLRYKGLQETALLLIDRSTSHPSDQFLRSEDGLIFCMYFPAKVKSLIQPMEQGIIANMKRFYRRELLVDLISKDVTIVDYQKNLSLKDAIRGIALGWDSTSEDMIRRCFAKILPTAADSIQVDSNGVDASITTVAFEKLLQQIPECNEYSSIRLEKWLGCDEAEPQKDCNPFKMHESQNQSVQHEQNDTREENIMFIDFHHEDVPQTIEIINSSELDNVRSTIIEPDSDDELMYEEESLGHRETLNQVQIQQQNDANLIYEDNSEVSCERTDTRVVSCKQALNALNVVLKFMKNESDSKYQDVIFLEKLKMDLHQKVRDSSAGIKTEIEYS